MNKPAYIVVTTAENREEAGKLAQLMVKKRLAACAQVSGPIHSTYWWQGKVESCPEWKCIFKTTEKCYKALETAIAKVHSYANPQIVAIPIDKGSSAYLSWLDETLHSMQ